MNHPKVKAEERTISQKKIKEYQEANRSIVYIDERGFAHDMPRAYGYSLKGCRCYGKHNWEIHRINAIGALFGKKLLTVSLFEQNINTDIFNS